jgi:hypothetical protein
VGNWWEIGGKETRNQRERIAKLPRNQREMSEIYRKIFYYLLYHYVINTTFFFRKISVGTCSFAAFTGLPERSLKSEVAYIVIGRRLLLAAILLPRSGTGRRWRPAGADLDFRYYRVIQAENVHANGQQHET